MISSSLIFASIIVYFGFLLAVAYYGRLKTGKGLEEFYLAGRKITGFIAALTYAATTYSVFMMVGLVGLTYAYGVGALGFELTYLFATVLLLTVFAPKFWVAGKIWGYMTPTQLLAERYESKLVGIVAAILCLIFLIPYMAIQGMGSAYLIEALSGGTVSYEVSLTFTILVIAVCALLGGFRGVAWTDTVQGLLMLSTSVYLFLYLLYTYLGGWGNFVSMLENQYPDMLTVPGPKNFFTIQNFVTLTTPWFFFALTNPQVSQRLFVSKSTSSLRSMIVGFFIFGFIYTVISILFGFMGVVLKVSASPPDKAMPLMLELFVPPILALIAMLGIVSAGVSTANSIMLSLASMVGRDIYGVLAKKPSEKVEMLVGYATILVEALIIWIFAIQRVGLISLLAVMASAGLLVQLPVIVGAFYWKGGSGIGACVSMISGGILTGVLYTLGISPLTLGPPVWGLIVTTLLFILVSLITKKPANAENFISLVKKELKVKGFIR
ncbi:MAG: sodium:solute symporter family protein [Candidatus Bathyarchaeota archaeon]